MPWFPDTETLAWSITWTIAFPTLVSNDVYLLVPNNNNEVLMVFQKLAFQTIWKDCKNGSEKNKWNTTCTTTRHNNNIDENLLNPVTLLCSRPIICNKTKWSNCLGYGEMTEDTVFNVLTFLRTMNFMNHSQTLNTCIVDLGCGNGTVLFAAAAAATTAAYDGDGSVRNPIQTRYIGIEIVRELYEDAIEKSKHWMWYDMNCTNGSSTTTAATTICTSAGTNQSYNENNNNNNIDITTSNHTTTEPNNNSKQCSIFEWYCDDFVNQKELITKYADLIFIHATVFENDLMIELNTICQQCRTGTYFCIVSKELVTEKLQGSSSLESSSSSSLPKNDDTTTTGTTTLITNNGGGIETIAELQLEMSWGIGTVFLQRKN